MFIASFHDDETKTVYEKLASELRNIEHSLKFLIDLANNKDVLRPSRIEKNEGFHLQVGMLESQNTVMESQNTLSKKS